MGMFLKETDRNVGSEGRFAQPTGGTNVEPPATLAELGISKSESTEAQGLVDIFEHHPELIDRLKQNARGIVVNAGC